MKKLVESFETFLNEAYKTVWMVFDNDKTSDTDIQIEGVFSSKAKAKKYEKTLMKSKRGEIIGIDTVKIDGFFVMTVLWTEVSDYNETPIKIFDTEKEALEFRNTNYKKYKDLQFGEFEIDEN